MKRLLQICTLLLLVSACDEEERPPGILDENRFRQVLVDVTLAEAWFSQKRVNPADSAELIQQYYDHIFEMHGIERDVFYKSMKYYLQHPEKMNETLQAVLDSLSTIQANTRKIEDQ